MNYGILRSLGLGGILLSAACSGQNSSSTLPVSPQSASAAARSPSIQAQSPGASAFGHSHKVCGDVGAGFARCHALQRDDLPIVSLAKRLEEFFVPGRSESVLLPRTSQALYLVQRVRDEAHRFAVTFHRTRRNASRRRALLLPRRSGSGGDRERFPDSRPC